MLGLGLSLGLAPIQGVPLFLWIAGIFSRRVQAEDGSFVRAEDGSNVYGDVTYG